MFWKKKFGIKVFIGKLIGRNTGKPKNGRGLEHNLKIKKIGAYMAFYQSSMLPGQYYGMGMEFPIFALYIFPIAQKKMQADFGLWGVHFYGYCRCSFKLKMDNAEAFYKFPKWDGGEEFF